jgi:hypothetical protein
LAAGATVLGEQGAHVGAAGPANVPGPQVRQTEEEVAPTVAEAEPSAQSAHEKAPAVPTRKRPAGHTTGEAVGVIEGVAEAEGVIEGVADAEGVIEGVTLGVGDEDGVGDGDGESELDELGVGVCDGDGVELGVCDGVGVGDGECELIEVGVGV